MGYAKNFNTSHVSINQGNGRVTELNPNNFNTSHVSINPDEYEKITQDSAFQYISCFY